MSILWGKDRHLDYWSALEAGVVPEAERRAMSLLASISDEKRFSFYCVSGMFPAMGNVTKRIYLVRRWTTVLELEDGKPKASWCILAQDRMIAPETDHVVAMKNILEGSELEFRQIGNAFHYSEDPFRGTVTPNDLKTSFPNPYYNPIGPEQRDHPYCEEYEMVDTPQGSMMPPRVELRRPRDQRRANVAREWNEDAALQFRELEGWIRTLRIKAEFMAEGPLRARKAQNVREAAVYRPWLTRQALLERAKDWVRIPSKDRYKLPPTHFEGVADRAMNYMGHLGAQLGIGQAGGNAGQLTFGTNATGFTTATVFTNNMTIAGNVFHQPIIVNATVA